MTIVIIILSTVAWYLLLWLVCHILLSDAKPKPNPLRRQWHIEDLERQVSVPLDELIAEAERKAIAEFEPRPPRFSISYVSPNYANPHSFDDRWHLRTVTSDQIRAMSVEEYRSFRRYALAHGWRSRD